jgi:N-acetylglucosamine-6-sulfatase
MSASDTTPASERGGPPNVIFIFTDDQAPRTLGVEGNQHVRTPRLDRLAREGVFFSRAYVPLPQCAPSRAVVLTGLYPHQNGVMTNEGALLKPDEPTFPSIFKQRGYATGLVGKWHLGEEQRPQCGFEDMWVTLPMPGVYFDPELWVDGRLQPHDGHLTDILTDYALRFVDEHRDEPFLLWLAYKAPHPPFVSHPDTRFFYDAATLPLPASITDDLSTKPAAQRNGKCHEWFLQSTPESIRRDLASYYSMISAIDHNVGRLIDHLREQGLDHRTIVIYMSDNGVLFGEHQMLRKGPAFYEELVRSPLIVWAPGRLDGGRKVDELVSTLDLFPTLCGLVNEPPPAGLPGENIWPLATGAGGPRRDAHNFEYLEKEATRERVPMRGLVTARYKYGLYLDDGAEELYDLQRDPLEMVNLAAQTEGREVLTSLRNRLAAWRRATGDVD